MCRRFSFIVPLFVGFGFSACGGASTSTVTSPSLSKCTVAATAVPASFPSSGGSGAVTVSTTRDCAWSASSDVGWIAMSDPSEGQGEGRVTYSVQPNAAQSERTGSIRVNEQAVQLTESAAPPPAPAPQPNPPAQPAPTPQPAPAPAPNPTPAPDPPHPPDPEPTPDPGNPMDFSGRITRLGGSCPDLTMDVSSRSVRTDQSTDYKKTSCQALKTGMDVKVTAVVLSTGMYLAKKVEKK